MQRDRLIAVGRILKSQGNKGEVKVLPLTDYPERFKSLTEVYLTKNDILKVVEVEKSRYHRGMAVLKFKGYDTIGDAQELKDMVVEVDEEDAIKLPEGRYFIHDIIGLGVYSDESEFLGEVVEIITTAGNDVYVVEGVKGEILIPSIHEVVLKVDVPSQKIIVRLMEGLIEP